MGIQPPKSASDKIKFAKSSMDKLAIHMDSKLIQLEDSISTIFDDLVISINETIKQSDEAENKEMMGEDNTIRTKREISDKKELEQIPDLLENASSLDET